jgi:hypothetical protein
MHVLAAPIRLAAAGRLAGHPPPGQLYIIINNNLDPAFALTKPKALSIAARAMNTFIKSDLYDTILDAYLFTQR